MCCCYVHQTTQRTDSGLDYRTKTACAHTDHKAVFVPDLVDLVDQKAVFVPDLTYTIDQTAVFLRGLVDLIDQMAVSVPDLPD